MVHFNEPINVITMVFVITNLLLLRNKDAGNLDTKRLISALFPRLKIAELTRECRLKIRGNRNPRREL